MKINLKENKGASNTISKSEHLLFANFLYKFVNFSDF